jgi:hypothetical protein
MPTGALSLLLLYVLLVRGTVAAELEVAGRDSAAIAAAIQRGQPGDTLRFPAGTFELAESVRPKSGLKLLGAGTERTIFIYVGSESVPFVQLTGCEDVEIGHLTLDGRQRPLGQDGVRADNSRRLLLHDLAIRGLAKGKSAFVHGIIFSGNNPTMERGVTDSVIRDCHIEDVGVGAEFGGGIRLAWGSNRNRVEGNVIRRTGRGGIFGDHSAELDIRHNRVEGSGGEGLGIELWGGCPRSLIEDNVIDHWLSVDQGNQTAVRRNVIGTDDGTLKGYGVEIIARDIIVTDNLVKRGAAIGLSVSNTPRKNNVYWGYNTIRDCIQWGAQLQGESGGIAHQYFYRCKFAGTVRGDARARYQEASGHGFRFNGNTRELVFEECTFRDNGGCGVQSCGANVDTLTFVRCRLLGNRQGWTAGFATNQMVEFSECMTGSPEAGAPPSTRPFTSPAPTANFRMPETIRAGTAAQFECASKAGTGEIVERLWDFNDGIAEVTPNPQHRFDRPDKYRVTLIVWDSAGRGARTEKTIEVLPAANTAR